MGVWVVNHLTQKTAAANILHYNQPMAKLSDKQVKNRLTKAKGWTSSSAGEITKTYTLPGFPQSLMFVSAVGVLAESMQHHPDITIKYDKVTLALTTHDDGGVSDKDFALAKLVDGLPALTK